MLQESNSIFFGKVIKKEEHHTIVRCYLGFDNIVDKKIDNDLLRDTKSDYLLMGIRTRMGTSELTISDADEYADEILKNYVSTECGRNKEDDKDVSEPNNNPQ